MTDARPRDATEPPIDPMIERRALSFFDAEQLTAAIREAALEHRQLEAGAFTGELIALTAGPVILNSGCYSRTLRARGCLPEEAVIVGAILEADRDGCINGYRFGARDLICYPAGAELDYLLPGRTRWAALQLPRTMLRDLDLSPALFAKPRVFSASLPGCARVVSRLARLVGTGLGVSFSDWMEEIAALADELRQLAGHGLSLHARPSYAERMRQLRLFEQLVHARIEEDLRIPRLCDTIGVAQRTLEQAFQEQLGLSPRRYLTILRLHAARNALLRGMDADIATIAASFGMRHPGRFATEYRNLFGESPSATGRG